MKRLKKTKKCESTEKGWKLLSGMKNESGLGFNEVVRSAKKVALKDGYDQYILWDPQDGYSFQRKFGQEKQIANFGQEIVGVVEVKFVMGVPQVSFKKLKEVSESKKKVTSSDDNWMGVPNAKFVYHGDWSDPEIVYNGFSINYFDVEGVFLDEYREENPDDKNDDGFDEWFKNQDPQRVQGVLDDSVYAYYGDQIEKAKPWLGMKDVYLLKDIKTDNPFVMYHGKRLELDDIAAEGGFDLPYDEYEFGEMMEIAQRSNGKQRKDLKDWVEKAAVTSGLCKVNEDLEQEILAMPNRIKEIEGELQNNAQKLFNMLADEYLDNDAKFDALLEERDALVKELCGCQKMNESSMDNYHANRQKIKDRISDIVGPEKADEVFEYWDRIQSGFNMSFEYDGFRGSVEKHLQRLADILGPEGKDIIDDINAKFTRQAKELSDWYDRMDREGRYTGD